MQDNDVNLKRVYIYFKETIGAMGLVQKIIFSVWLVLSSFIIMLLASVEPYQQGGYILGLVFITGVFWVLFKVWADKKT